MSGTQFIAHVTWYIPETKALTLVLLDPKVLGFPVGKPLNLNNTKDTRNNNKINTSLNLIFCVRGNTDLLGTAADLSDRDVACLFAMRECR